MEVPKDQMASLLENGLYDSAQMLIMSSGGGDAPQKGKTPIKAFFSRKTKKNKATPSPIITTTTTATASITTSTSLPSAPSQPRRSSATRATPSQNTPPAPSPPPNPITYTTRSPTPHLYPLAHTTPSPTPHLYPSIHTTPSPTPPPNLGATYYHHGYMMPGYYPPPPPPYNSGYMIPPQTCTPSPNPGAEEQIPVENHQYIEPAGDIFTPWRAPVDKVASIIKAKYDAPYLSWTKIPIAVRVMWFREFEIWRNFEKHGSARLSDYFNDARNTEQHPDWIGESIWTHLCDAWSKPDYVKVREQNKQNWGSDSGGLGSSLHTGGAIPHTEYRHRMKNVLGREPTPIELHTRTHQRKTDKQWVDSRAQKVHVLQGDALFGEKEFRRSLEFIIYIHQVLFSK